MVSGTASMISRSQRSDFLFNPFQILCVRERECMWVHPREKECESGGVHAFTHVFLCYFAVVLLKLDSELV